MKTLKHISQTLPLIAVLALIFSGCPEKKGPLEKAGEKMDEALDDIGEGFEEAVEDLDDH